MIEAKIPNVTSSLSANTVSNKSTRARVNRYAIAALFLVFIVVGLGAFTRLSHSGLGCPDWPGCYGFLTSPDTQSEVVVANNRFPNQVVESEKGWIEMIHRYVAGLALLLTLALFLTTAKNKFKGQEAPYFKHISVILGVIVLQAAFGMWTVTLKLWPQVVTAHLLGGFTTFSLYYLLWLRSKSNQIVLIQISKRAKLAVFLVFVMTVIQVFIGGWMASNYAAYACPDLPLCQGALFPTADYGQGFNLFQSIGPNYLGGLLDGEARVAIHFAHRVGALVLMLAVFAVGFYIFNKNKQLAIRLLFILMLQISLGVMNVYFHIPIQIAVLHNLVAVLLLVHMLEVLYVLIKAKEGVDEYANKCTN